MSAPHLSSLHVLGPSSFYDMAFTAWQATPTKPPRPITLCVHGLTRNGRDFDPLAAALSEAGHPVFCPDMAGRGRSDWLPDATEYSLPTYMAACSALIAHGATTDGKTPTYWVGTSMGGLIGMALAALPNSPIERLVINDIGPFVPGEALARIAGYVADQPTFDSLDRVEAFLRTRHASFGPLSDAYWQHLARHSANQSPDGSYRLTYDAKIAEKFTELAAADLDLWSLWDQITCPVLIMRGAESDLLPLETATEMTRRGPQATLMQWPETGHAPALEHGDQINAIRRFFE